MNKEFRYRLERFAFDSDKKVALIIFLLSGAVTSFFQSHCKRALFNDEAYELMITQGVSFDRFYFMSPAHSYPMGSVAPIEMGPLYVHRFLFWLCRDWLITRDDFLVPIHAFSALVLMFSCVVFFFALRRFVARKEAGIAAVVFALSYIPILFSLFVTRNTVTIIWGCLLMLFVPQLSNPFSTGSRATLRSGLICAALTIAGAWTFTSYILVAIAVWGAMGLTWLRFDRDWRKLAGIVFSGSIFLATYLILAATDTFSMKSILFRGGYAVSGGTAYLQNAILTLLSPVIYKGSGAFLVEDVHLIVGRAGLAAPLALCFLIGIGTAFRSRHWVVFLAVSSWTIGLLLCALGGPNAKYVYSFFPLTLFLALLGVRTIGHFCAVAVGSNRASWVVASILLCSIGVDLHNLWLQPSDLGRERMNELPRVVAETCIESAKSGNDTYVQVGMGFDILNWYLWPSVHGDQVKRCSVTAGLPDLFERYPPKKGAVLYLDYPPESLNDTLPGWVKPPISIRRVYR